MSLGAALYKVANQGVAHGQPAVRPTGLSPEPGGGACGATSTIGCPTKSQLYERLRSSLTPFDRHNRVDRRHSTDTTMCSQHFAQRISNEACRSRENGHDDTRHGHVWRKTLRTTTRGKTHSDPRGEHGTHFSMCIPAQGPNYASLSRANLIGCSPLWQQPPTTKRRQQQRVSRASVSMPLLAIARKRAKRAASRRQPLKLRASDLGQRWLRGWTPMSETVARCST